MVVSLNKSGVAIKTKDAIILAMGTSKKVPLILGNPKPYITPYKLYRGATIPQVLKIPRIFGDHQVWNCDRLRNAAAEFITAEGFVDFNSALESLRFGGFRV